MNDFEDIYAVFGQWDGDFRQMSRGKFQGRILVADGQLARVFQAEASQSLLTRGMDSTSYATFIPITARNEETRWQGRTLSRGQLIIKGPEVEYNNQTRRDCAIRSLLVPLGNIRHAARILSGKEADGAISSWAAIRPSPGAMGRFEKALAALLASSMREPGFLRSPRGYALESECLRRLIDVVSDPTSEESTPLYWADRSRLVKRAVDLMHERLEQPLTALYLCAQLEVSDRVLRRAFRESFGLGPLAYFRVMRLHAVRTALRAARGGDEGVANIVRRWGFNRLGSFADEYRLHFGELPSEALGVRGQPGVQRRVRAELKFQSRVAESPCAETAIS